MESASRISAGPKLPIRPEITELNRAMASEVTLDSVGLWLYRSSGAFRCPKPFTNYLRILPSLWQLQRKRFVLSCLWFGSNQ